MTNLIVRCALLGILVLIVILVSGCGISREDYINIGTHAIESYQNRLDEQINNLGEYIKRTREASSLQNDRNEVINRNLQTQHNIEGVIITFVSLKTPSEYSNVHKKLVEVLAAENEAIKSLIVLYSKNLDDFDELSKAQDKCTNKAFDSIRCMRDFRQAVSLYQQPYITRAVDAINLFEEGLGTYSVKSLALFHLSTWALAQEWSKTATDYLENISVVINTLDSMTPPSDFYKVHNELVKALEREQESVSHLSNTSDFDNFVNNFESTRNTLKNLKSSVKTFRELAAKYSEF